MVILKSENGKYSVTINGEKRMFDSFSAALKYIDDFGKERENISNNI